MPCCKILIFFIALLLIFTAFVWFYLYKNNYRLYYIDLKKLFKGAYKSEKIGRYYDEWHERYAETYGDTIQSYRTEDLNELHAYIMKSAGLKDGMHILDAGCGMGGPAVFFAKHLNISIEGITISEKQAKAAQEQAKEHALEKKINFTAGDFHKIDKLYAPASFDLVLFLESYGHARYQKELLRATAKVLKKGGRIYIKDYFKKDLPDNAFQKKLIKMGLKNMDKVYRYNTPDLYHTIYILRKLNFELRLLKIPDFTYSNWDKNSVIQSFHEKNNIALYNNKDELFDQNNGRFIVDPYEMIFVKR